jgi:hypothetical protein
MKNLIDDMTISDIESLVKSKIPEDLNIEYKSEVKISNDSEKKEFLADISAFANAYGGTIFYGIKEKEGVPINIIGIETDNIDNLIQTMEQLIISCIQPRIISYKINNIKLGNSNYLVNIKIPQSWNSPHMVHHSRDTKFYLRDNNGKHQMSIDELKYAFKFSDSLSEQIKSFHSERIEKIRNNKLQFNFPDKPFFIAHWIPLRAFQSLSYIKLDEIRYIPQLMASSYNYHRFNVDGLTAYALDNEQITYYYTQIFRNGIIESVDFDIVHKEAPNNVFALQYFTDKIYKKFNEFLKFIIENRLSQPIIFLLSIVNAKDIPVDYKHRMREINVLDRNEINLNEIIIDNFDFENLELLIKPVLDSLWNACGFSTCMMYNEDNKLMLK